VRARLVPLLVVLFAAGCRQGETRVTATASSSAPTSQTNTPQDGGTLIRRLRSDVNSLNMVHLTTEPEKLVLSLVLDPIIDVDARLNLVPALAKSWEISPDGLSYTFNLDPRATFSDGMPVRAQDVIFTLRRIVDPASESVTFAGLFEGLDLTRTVAIDPRTVRVVFARKRSSQLAAFNIGVMPEHIYGKGDFKNDFVNVAIGSGPYQVLRRDAGQQIILQRRKNYWRTRPHLERIVFKIIPDDTVAWNALKRGELDESRISSDQWHMEGRRADILKILDIKKFYTLDYNWIAWNNKHPLLSDKRLRRALAMCMDRRSIINNVYFGTARLITGPFTPDQWAYNPDVPPIEYNPTEARRIFAAAGWNDTNSDGWLDKGGKVYALDVLLPAGSKTSELQAQILQEALKQIGVRLNLSKVDGATWSERVFSGQYVVTFGAWGQDLDPDVFTLFHSSQAAPAGQNFAFYSRPEADRLIEQGREEFDPGKRREIYQKLHAMLAEDQPFAWTVQPTSKWAVNKRVQNVEDASGLGLFFWYPGSQQWWIPADKRTHDRSDSAATR